MGGYEPGEEETALSESDVETREPAMYRVLLHNDDYTTMDFVVAILMSVFNKAMGDATRIMLNVHKIGIGICGVFTFEVAETKVQKVHALAHENGFPLKCTMERE